MTSFKSLNTFSPNINRFIIVTSPINESYCKYYKHGRFFLTIYISSTCLKNPVTLLKSSLQKCINWNVLYRLPTDSDVRMNITCYHVGCTQRRWIAQKKNTVHLTVLNCEYYAIWFQVPYFCMIPFLRIRYSTTHAILITTLLWYCRLCSNCKTYSLWKNVLNLNLRQWLCSRLAFKMMSCSVTMEARHLVLVLMEHCQRIRPVVFGTLHCENRCPSTTNMYVPRLVIILFTGNTTLVIGHV